MLTSSAPRRGVTLIELLVTMTVGGIALSLVTLLCVRQQRVVSDLAQASAVSAQLRDAGAILPIDIRALASASGDIREARDTSLEIRATIASGVVCDTSGAAITLAPAVTDVVSFASIATPIEPGDSAWLLVPNDTAESWTPHRVDDVFSGAGRGCGARGPDLGVASGAQRVTLALDGVASAKWIGAPLRVTRPLRYSLYQSSDNAWWLGERDWNAVAARFNTIQPVAGPFLPPASGGLRFEYFDSVGGELVSPVEDASLIALMRVELRGQTKNAPRVLTTSAPGNRLDSLSMWVLLRNRR
jgi:prepilin-type N-terminal cleavage/methylation domain-containing protein